MDAQMPDPQSEPEEGGRSDPQAMGDQSTHDIEASLPPGAGTKPDDARGDVDRLQPYDDGAGFERMSEVDVPPRQLDDEEPR